MPFHQYLERYHELDLCLDPFPYNGGTTTLDALWMGVPVITLAGRTAVGRGGVSILSNLGLTELIARTPEQYVAIAIALAGGSRAALAASRGLAAADAGVAAPGRQAYAADVESGVSGDVETWC